MGESHMQIARDILQELDRKDSTEFPVGQALAVIAVMEELYQGTPQLCFTKVPARLCCHANISITSNSKVR